MEFHGFKSISFSIKGASGMLYTCSSSWIGEEIDIKFSKNLGEEILKSINLTHAELQRISIGFSNDRHFFLTCSKPLGFYDDFYEYSEKNSKRLFIAEKFFARGVVKFSISEITYKPSFKTIVKSTFDLPLIDLKFFEKMAKIISNELIYRELEFKSNLNLIDEGFDEKFTN